MQLRPEQRIVVDKCKKVLDEHKVVYLAAEVRTGKTIMSMFTAHESGYTRILFVTKKKAIKSIESDYQKSGLKFVVFHVTNYEQLSKMQKIYDLIIMDEGHSCGAYPKPPKRVKELKLIVKSHALIILSGTPSPESYSQFYHQFYVSENGPFANYKTFYKWASDFVTIGKKYFNGIEFNDYSKAIEAKVKEAIAPFMVNFSQAEAGFTSFVEEEIRTVPINPNLYELMKRLKRDKVYRMKDETIIICDTPVKMQSAFHQISSGTIKVDESTRKVLDRSKAKYIRDNFNNRKIAIFYKFICEGDLLKKEFPNFTDSPEEFNTNHDRPFICQMVSGREGINLSSADYLVMYNIDFSATTYWQIRARMQTKDRKQASKIAWLFSEKGLEREIHKTVMNKKDFTLSHFRQFFNGI